MLRRGCRCAEVSTSPGKDLRDLFMTLSHVNHPTLATGPRWKFFPWAVRQSPAVPVSVVHQSAWQPVNVPTAVQFDFNPEYKLPWAFDGSTFAREPEPYQAPAGAMRAPMSAFGFVLQTNQYQTIPEILAAGSGQGGKRRG